MWTWLIRGGLVLGGALAGIGTDRVIRRFRRKPEQQKLLAAARFLAASLEVHPPVVHFKTVAK